jgi:hypothetical protein
MTPPDPTHRVTVQSRSTRAIRSYLAFSLIDAEVYLAVYRALGWTGEIEEILRVTS